MGSSRKNWERVNEGRTDYAQVNATDVVVGSHRGSGHTDSAGSVSHQEFLDGRYQDLVRSGLGEKVLAEMVAAVRNASEDPEFQQQRQRTLNTQHMLEAIPAAPELAALLMREDLVQGRWHYCNAGAGSALSAEWGSITLTQDRATCVPSGGVATGVRLPGFHGGVVGAAGHWATNVGGLVVLDPAGRLVSSTALASAPWGAALRGWDVFTTQDRLLFVYQWFDARDGKPGVCEFRVGQGFTGRCELDQVPVWRSPPPLVKPERDD